MNSVYELVQAEEITVEYPTYPVGQPEKHPLFFEKRVYQGSNGKVYPLPFIDKVFDVAESRQYQAIRLENEFVRVLLLPEFGGRIHAIQDKTNHDYDIIYHQKVIKPALVGLAGPWISGGIVEKQSSSAAMVSSLSALRLWVRSSPISKTAPRCSSFTGAGDVAWRSVKAIPVNAC